MMRPWLRVADQPEITLVLPKWNHSNPGLMMTIISLFLFIYVKSIQNIFSYVKSRLVHAQEEIRDERRRADQIAEKLRQCQIDLESLPLLRAQIEVYKTDFNAERGAREKIAGERADLLDEIRQLRSSGAAAGDRLRNENMVCNF